MVNKLKRAPGIFLTGFMGSGKSTIGHALADHLGWDFVDLDAAIESHHQTTIADIFETRGEPEFRRLETETIRGLLAKIVRGSPSVVALGGGAFVQQVNYDLIETQGVSIWLDCPLDTLLERIPDDGTRPLAKDREAFRRLYEDRRSAYARADYTIDATCDVAGAVHQILELPFWK